MKTSIQELIEKYNIHLNNTDLDKLSGRDLIKIVLVDLISYQLKEKEQIIEACKYGFRVDAESDDWISDEEEAERYYKETFKQD